MSDNCPYAHRTSNAGAIRCRLQSETDTKWDFCIHQYMCRVTGRYEHQKTAVNCKLRKGNNKSC